ncbi:MAG: M48 family metallopeptidase [Fimbriimonadaceae bacterium]
MTETQFQALIDEYAAKYKQNPEKFQEGTGKFIKFGSAMLVVMLIASIALFLLAIVIILSGNFLRLGLYLIIGVGAILWGLLKTVFTPFRDEEAILIPKSEHPEIYHRINSLAHKLDLPNVEYVYVDEQLNASAYRKAKIGILGSGALAVTLGLRLMASMPPEEMDFILAHELAHHARKDTNRSWDLSRVSAMWQAIAVSNSSMLNLGGHFANWYAPRLYARSIVMSRDAEFGTDSVAAQVIDPKVGQMALLRMDVVSEDRYKTYNNQLNKRILRGEDFSQEHEDYVQMMKQPPSKPSLPILQAMIKRTSFEDSSHPTGFERAYNLGMAQPSETELAQIGNQIDQPLPETSLESYFGTYRFDLYKRFHDQYMRMHGEAVEKAKALYAMDEQKASELLTQTEIPLNAKESANVVKKLAATHRDAEALSFAKDALAKFPDDIELRFSYAALNFDNDSAGSISVMEQMKENREYRLGALGQLVQFYDRVGDSQKSREAEREYMAYKEERDELFEKLADITKKWPLNPAELEEEFIKELIQRANASKELQAIYIAQRQHDTEPGMKVIYVALLPKKKTFVTDENDWLNEVVMKFTDGLDIPAYTWVLGVTEKYALTKQLKSTPEFCIWQQQK